MATVSCPAVDGGGEQLSGWRVEGVELAVAGGGGEQLSVGWRVEGVELAVDGGGEQLSQTNLSSSY